MKSKTQISLIFILAVLFFIVMLLPDFALELSNFFGTTELIIKTSIALLAVILFVINYYIDYKKDETIQQLEKDKDGLINKIKQNEIETAKLKHNYENRIGTLQKEFAKQVSLLEMLNISDAMMDKATFQTFRNEFKGSLIHIEKLLSEKEPNFYRKSEVRFNVYIHHEPIKAFILASRFSTASKYSSSTGQDEYPDNKGFLSEIWESGNEYLVKKYPTKDYQYERHLKKKCGYTDDDFERMKMKSRSFYGYKLWNAERTDVLAVLVIESIAEYDFERDHNLIQRIILDEYDLLIKYINLQLDSKYLKTLKLEKKHEKEGSLRSN